MNPLPDYPAEAVERLRYTMTCLYPATPYPDCSAAVALCDPADLAALLSYVEGMKWRPISEAPTKTVVIVAFQTSLGKWRRTLAAYYGVRELEASMEFEGGEYDEDRDEYFCPAGWYEPVEAETGLDYNLHHLSETPLCWLPLPPAPDREG